MARRKKTGPAEDLKDVDGIQADLGYFKNTKWPVQKAP